LLPAYHDARNPRPRGRTADEPLREDAVADNVDPPQRGAVGIERVRRKIEADGVEFVRQLLQRRPVGNDGQGEARASRKIHAAEQAHLLAVAVVGGALRVAQDALDRLEGLATVGIEAIEGAGIDEVLELALVENLGVEPAGEIEEVAKR